MLTQIVEIGYQESKNLPKLSFLHLVTGNAAGLKQVKETAKKEGDVVTEFNVSIYQGDIQSRIKTLVDMGQVALAYQSAVNHGLDDMAAAIKKTMTHEVKYSKKSVALIPPKPLMQNYEEALESRII